MADRVLQEEFEIGLNGTGVFFDNRNHLGRAKHAHTLRTAFDLLELDGIFCAENAPLVYFKKVEGFNSEEIASLHRKFWNHGGAPVLVLLSEREVHIYSALVRPDATISSQKRISALVEILDRTSAVLREFLPAVESGEYFRRNKGFFDTDNRVDRQLLNNLEATRDNLIQISDVEPKVIDALLCRVVFTCYLFDRGIIGAGYLKKIVPSGIGHLRDILAMRPRNKAKESLYLLFHKLGKDFNGDLFSDDLDLESRLVKATLVEPLDRFFHGSDVISGQEAFWPYDFSAIPVEAISSIYERFLHSARPDGAYYTPRALAELVIDMGLDGPSELLGKRFLDPSCGSGIFLVAIFNRLAEEWKIKNPKARNDRRARELREILCSSLHGVDINPTACRISAFSLYLAYLDQLSPRDIKELRDSGHRLPKLVRYSNAARQRVEGNITCGDFFAEGTDYATNVDLVVGNPPWGSLATENTPASIWCKRNECSVPDKQIAAAFVMKAPNHVSGKGKICFVLPYGILFNHGNTAVSFQRDLFAKHSVDRVLNLADYVSFLFAEATHPALVISYRGTPPKDLDRHIDYWVPKTDWLVTKAALISIAPEDRSSLRLSDVMTDLQSEDAPQIWKRWYWATARDRRLLDRLSLHPRIRDHVRQTREKNSDKPWLIAEGWQPLGQSDRVDRAVNLQLPSKRFIDATSRKLDLLLLPDDCIDLSKKEVLVRDRSNKNTAVFRAPHVIVSQGFTRVAYADFDVSFRHALRGITGPEEDRELLMFLAAYLRSSVSRYFLFHTSSNWGVSRQKVHVEELLRLPLPLPNEMPDPAVSQGIVNKIANIISNVTSQASNFFGDREGIIGEASDAIDALLYEYFDVQPNERTLIEDTLRVLAPSMRPSRNRPSIPTIEPSNESEREAYISRLCSTLNTWSLGSNYEVRGEAFDSTKLGIGIVVLQKALKQSPAYEFSEDFGDLLVSLKRISKAVSRKVGVFELMRGATVFDEDRCYIVKPLARRYWTETAALNNADEIAGSILTYSGVATA